MFDNERADEFPEYDDFNNEKEISVTIENEG